MTRHWLIITFALLFITLTKVLGFHQKMNETIEYRVSILRGGKIRCGGTILDDYHILTAASCVLDLAGNVYRSTIDVLLDEDDKPMRAEMIHVPWPVDKTCKTYRRVENIAIIELQENIGLAQHPILKKINLPEFVEGRIYDEYENKSAVVAGYGVTKIDVMITANGDLSKATKVAHPKLLQMAKAQVVPKKECGKHWKIASPIQPTEMCARIEVQKYHGVCQADFGNGLIYNNTVIGVLISSNALCYEERDAYNLPAVYTRVAPYVEFIHQVLSGDLLTEGVCSFQANDSQFTYRELLSLVFFSVILGLISLAIVMELLDNFYITL